MNRRTAGVVCGWASRVVMAAAAGVALASLAACNTVEGAAQDVGAVVEGTGKTTEKIVTGEVQEERQQKDANR